MCRHAFFPFVDTPQRQTHFPLCVVEILWNTASINFHLIGSGEVTTLDKWNINKFESQVKWVNKVVTRLRISGLGCSVDCVSKAEASAS